MACKRWLGLCFLVVGGLAWPAGYALGYSGPQILPFHLLFIFSGLALRGSHLLELIKRRQLAKKQSS